MLEYMKITQWFIFFTLSRCLNESKNIQTLNVSIQVNKNKDNKKRTNSTHEKKKEQRQLLIRSKNKYTDI